MAHNWNESEIKFSTNLLEPGKSVEFLSGGEKLNAEERFNGKEKPPWVKGKANWAFEHAREQEEIALRSNPVYQFVMLVTSFTNEKMNKYWSSHSEEYGVNDVGVTTIEPCPMSKRKVEEEDIKHETGCAEIKSNIQFHNWYVNTPWADSLIYLSPSIFGHIEEAFVAIKQRWIHLSNATLQAFTESAGCRTMFAKLVSMCIRTSDVLSGRRYQMDASYRRINIEKQKLMNYWRHVILKEGVLVFCRPGHCDTNNSPYLADLDTMFKLSREINKMNNF
jgi:hypothetical protein